MATITDEKGAFGEACLDTCFGSICVKKRGKAFYEMDGHDHGILVKPVVESGPAATARLEQVMATYHPEVIVRGWGWGAPPNDAFVWTGTSDEFNEIWEID